MYLALEHDSASWVGTFDAAARGAGAHKLGVVMVRPPFDLGGDDFERLQELVEDIDPQLLVVDCLRRASTADENNSGEIAELMRRVQALAGGERVVLVLHHVNAAGDRPRGSTDLMAGADRTITCTRRGDRVSLNVESHDAAPARWVLREVVEADGYTFHAEEEGTQDPDLDRLKGAILAELRARRAAASSWAGGCARPASMSPTPSSATPWSGSPRSASSSRSAGAIGGTGVSSAPPRLVLLPSTARGRCAAPATSGPRRRRRGS